MNKKFLIPAVAIACLPALCDCSGSSVKQSLPDLSSLPDNVAGVSISVYNNDSVAFASLVQYPLSRPYPLRDIADSAQMVAYYPIMVDDSLRSMAVNADPGWSEYGWRGWALDDGAVWVGEDGIYAVPYMSEAEKKNYDALVEKEMATLPADMQKGYVPVGCFREINGTTVYRIDRKEGTDSYRLAVYGKGAVRTAPDRVFTGKRVVEGSANNEHYSFSDGKADAVLVPEPMSYDEMPSVWIGDVNNGAETAITPVYWLDLVR